MLDRFSSATGLHINFDKSTVVPIHVEANKVESFQAVPGCRIGGFPQTYLGLPLSSEKLLLSAFAPLIAKSDRYLSRWWASLLNDMGRMMLINSVMDS